jgi:hypothetical protein
LKRAPELAPATQNLVEHVLERFEDYYPKNFTSFAPRWWKTGVDHVDALGIFSSAHIIITALGLGLDVEKTTKIKSIWVNSNLASRGVEIWQGCRDLEIPFEQGQITHRVEFPVTISLLPNDAISIVV